MAEREKLLTIGQAAGRLGVSGSTLRKWADQGLIGVVRLPSGYRRFTLAEVERMRREIGLEKVHSDWRDGMDPDAPTFPAPGTDGRWWQARGKVEFTCGHCSTKQDDWPAVMRYRPELDHGDSDTHPGWRHHGWLAWWQCPRCGHDTFTAVNDDRVEQWSSTVGPWQHRE